MTDETTSKPHNSEAIRSERDRKKAEKRRKQRVEFAGAIIIGIAAILTAVATLNGGDADGRVERENTDAIAATLVANSFFNDANAQRLVERDWIFSFISEAANDTPAADVLVAAMPDDVALLASEWLTANQAGFADPENEFIDDPFSGEYAALDGLESVFYQRLGDSADAAAQCAFFEASVAGVQGDSYGLSTVFLAIALVVGGIAALLTSKAAQIIVITTAILSLVAGGVELALAGDPDSSRSIAAAEFFTDDNGNPLIATDELGVPFDIPAALLIADQACAPNPAL